jgi:hypothetical protein
MKDHGTRLQDFAPSIKTLAPQIASVLEGNMRKIVQYQAINNDALLEQTSLLGALRMRMEESQKQYTWLCQYLLQPQTVVIPPRLPPSTTTASSPPAITVTSHPGPTLPIENNMAVDKAVLNGPPPLLIQAPPPQPLPYITETLQPVFPPFQMSRTLQTVRDLWNEYNKGLGGLPSVKSMYEGKDQSLKNGNDSERRFFDGRKVILWLVTQLAEDRGYTGNEAVSAMDIWVGREKISSLNALKKQILKDEPGVRRAI